MNWFLVAFKKYAEFNGRARRKEYWMFWLFNYLITMLLFIVELSSGTFNFGNGIGPLTGLFGLIMFLPSISVTVRRLHDVNKSGWFILISLIPIIGGIWLFIKLVTNSTPGTNKYGENPKGIEFFEKEQKEEDNTFQYLIMSFLISAFIAFGSFAIFTYIPIFNSLEKADTIKQFIMAILFVISFYYIFNIYLKDDKLKKELKKQELES